MVAAPEVAEDIVRFHLIIRIVLPSVAIANADIERIELALASALVAASIHVSALIRFRKGFCGMKVFCTSIAIFKSGRKKPESICVSESDQIVLQFLHIDPCASFSPLWHCGNLVWRLLFRL
jgi:hypothetical protein